MHFTGLALSAAMALTVAAVPLASPHAHLHAHKRQAASATTFPLYITNQCTEAMSFAIFQIDAAFNMDQVSATATINPGESGTIQAPFQETGLRLSGNADWTDQWQPQALFEFGYTPSYSGSLDGTAYDISLMPGSDPAIGIEARVMGNGQGSRQCPTKLCTPDNCPLDQGWTNEDQNSIGSPADTVCYHGMAGIQVTWCPQS